MRITAATTAAILLTLATAPAAAQAPPAAHPATSTGITWGPAPDVFPAGAQMAIIQGDPASPGVFTLRLRFPDGYRLPPHIHPTDEHVTVISGTFRVGMGPRFTLRDAVTLQAGGFITAPAGHAHFAAAEGVTVVQVHAVGPFAITFVDPVVTPDPATRP